jgi:MscS family membrane protein
MVERVSRGKSGPLWLFSRVPLLARQFWTTASILTIAACVWLFILLNDRVEHYIRRRLVRSRNMGTASVIRLGRRVLAVLIIFTGLVFGLYHFGLNPTAALAGLGVGGVAVALAAQKTLENVLGGISLIFDRVVQTGDTLQVGDTLGTVEDIGCVLRGSALATGRWSACPMGRSQTLSLKISPHGISSGSSPASALHDTTAAQMQSVVRDVRKFLAEHPHVEPGSAYVRFLQFGNSSLDLDVSSLCARR